MQTHTNTHTRTPLGYGYVSNLAVSPSARRRGVAEALMAAAESLAASWGCRTHALHCNPDNAAAVGLYRKLGYRATVQEPAWMPMLQGRPSERCTLFIKPVKRRQRQPSGSPAVAAAEAEAPEAAATAAATLII
jgi:predicted N-acetyltransferase YhbS